MTLARKLDLAGTVREVLDNRLGISPRGCLIDGN